MKMAWHRTRRIMRNVGGSWKMRLVVAVVTIVGATAQNLTMCCEKAVGTCHGVCEKMSRATDSSAVKDEQIHNIYKFCPHDLTEFWICMNQTVQALISGSGWWGGVCCSRAWAPSCRNACARAGDKQALAPACRLSDETALYDCVQRQQEAQWCCSQTGSVSCHEACQNAVWQIGLSQIDYAAKSRALDICDQSPELMQCLRELTTSTVHDDTSRYLPCCNETASQKCRSSCESILRQSGESQEIAGALSKDCGAPALHEALWQCFLRKDATPDTKDIIPHDVAKLHCCQKAATINCKKLCFNTFNTGWQSNWQTFYAECYGDPQEMELTQCIEEVEAPCALGCSGLTFCSHLNNRVTSLFRSCTATADLAAHRAQAEHGRDQFVSLAGYRLPIRNSSECDIDLWKSVSCALHVKPCTTKGHSSAVCWADCVRLVAACVWWERAAPALSARALCARLAAPPRAPACLAAADYVTAGTEPPLLSAEEMITSPCTGNPCNSTQVCVVNRHCRYGDNCARYSCIDGCPMGDNSPVIIPLGSWARVPMKSTGNNACYKICSCGRRGLTNCQPLPCVLVDSCRLLDKEIESGGKYYLECNPCACVSGERVCSRRVCTSSRALSGLPCNCPPHYLPVGIPGRSFPNACLAKCAGAADAQLQFGARGGCGGAGGGGGGGGAGGAGCARGAACAPRRAPALHNSHARAAPQHICVNTSHCAAQPASPACDSSGVTHTTACHLFTSGRKFAYWGHCLTGCNKFGTVCGVNGVTYISECAAWAEYVSVDYSGECAAVGHISDKMEPKCQIDNIVCPPLKKPKCQGFTPPGACCPKCGGALRILYSRKQIDRALYGTNMSAAVINLENIIKALDRHIKIAECALRGFLTIETEIFISVETILEDPTDLQLHVCVLEAEKLGDLINRDSAFFSSDLGLSALSYALTVHTYPTQGASYMSVSGITIVLATILPLVLR